MANFINFVLYQLGWAGTALFAAKGQGVLAALVCGVVLALHLGISARHSLSRELRLALFAIGVGALWESFLQLFGLVSYQASNGVFAPLWIILMWPLFTSTLNYSLAWLNGKPIWSVLLGGIGGPAAFLAGDRLGAIELQQGALSVAVLALGWALLFPFMQLLASRLEDRQVKQAIAHE